MRYCDVVVCAKTFGYKITDNLDLVAFIKLGYAYDSLKNEFKCSD